MARRSNEQWQKLTYRCMTYSGDLAAQFSVARFWRENQWRFPIAPFCTWRKVAAWRRKQQRGGNNLPQKSPGMARMSRRATYGILLLPVNSGGLLMLNCNDAGAGNGRRRTLTRINSGA